MLKTFLLFAANAPASDKKDLLSELELMKKLKPHPHVIKLLGCVTESGKNNTDFVILRVMLLTCDIVQIGDRHVQIWLSFSLGLIKIT